MNQARVVPLSLLTVLLCSVFSPAQQSTTAANAAVPPMIQFSNVATSEGGNSMSGVVSITFSLYAAQQGGEPLWTETQNNIPLDSTGHYSVQLGITHPNGMPTPLFTTGEARWLGVRITEQVEQPRVLLLSVPYALKAGDAATIGGLPPSAFVLAAPGTTSASTAFMGSAAPTSDNAAGAPTATDVTGLGTVNFIPLWTSTSNIENSVLFQSATSPFKIGINTITPATTLDVKGAGTIRGTLGLPPTGVATAAKGANSQPLNLVASAFNTTAAVNQTFQWQAEPAANDTAAASGTLNLLFGVGAAKPSETGLHIASNGLITFAAGQTFPGGGGGSGTVTSVASGQGLLGGPITSSGTLTIDTTVVPQLAAANTFTGNQTVNGNLSATGVVTGSSFQIGSNLFAYGYYANANAFLGFAGSANTAILAQYDTAVGSGALFQDTSGENTALGFEALNFNTTGSFNAGIGTAAGNTFDDSNLTGSFNTALGANTYFSSGTLKNATAIGAYAEVAESNAIVLGSFAGSDICQRVSCPSASTNVGIGTTKPGHLLDVAGAVAFDSTGLNNGSSFIDLTFGISAGEGISSSRTAGPNQYGIDLYTDFARRISIEQHGNVGIGTTTPSNLLTVVQGGGAAIADGWSVYSSRRWKTNIQTLHGALAKIEQLRGVSYDRKDTGKHEVGVIAEEVGEVVPEVVSFEENGKDARGVDYSRLTALLIEATKEQQVELSKALRQIKRQQNLLRSQTSTMRSLEAEVREARETLRKLKTQVAASQPALVAVK
jgi:hypothetical protein